MVEAVAIRTRNGSGVVGENLIKQAVERRSTRAWDVSIRNALDEIVTRNKRHKAGGWYLSSEELAEALREAYTPALEWAALKAFGGAYTADQLRFMHDAEGLWQEALRLIEQMQQGQNG